MALRLVPAPRSWAKPEPSLVADKLAIKALAERASERPPTSVAEHPAPVGWPFLELVATAMQAGTPSVSEALVPVAIPSAAEGV